MRRPVVRIGNPTLLIAASSETMEVAQAIQLQLRDTIRARIWTGEMPVPSQAERESLMEALATADYAVMVHSGDEMGELTGRVPRDLRNGEVLVVPSLFVKHLGICRTFIIYDDAHPPRMIVDWGGPTVMWFDSFCGEGLVAAVESACSRIRRKIRRIESDVRAPTSVRS